MQKELETPNYSNTPGFAGSVGRVELLGKTIQFNVIQIGEKRTDGKLVFVKPGYILHMPRS